MALSAEASAAIVLALCAVLSWLAYRTRVLTWDGSVASFAVGLVIGVFGGVAWLLLLLFFLLSSFVATRYRFALKEALGVQEGREGERRATNVLANGLPPAVLAVLGGTGVLAKDLSALLFVSSLAVAGADTLASEIGVLSKRTYLITTFRPVPAGTDGGVSRLGTGAALAAAVYTAAFGFLVLGPGATALDLPRAFPPSEFAIIPAIAGFLGCNIDSVLGATLERAGWLDKKSNNMISATLGALAAFALYVALS